MQTLARLRSDACSTSGCAPLTIETLYQQNHPPALWALSETALFAQDAGASPLAGCVGAGELENHASTACHLQDGVEGELLLLLATCAVVAATVPGHCDHSESCFSAAPQHWQFPY